MRNKRELWTIANDGSVVTNTGYNLYKEERKANSIWENKIFTACLIVACCLVDIVMFKQLFSQYSYDSPAKQVVETLGMIVAFDIIPIYIGTQIRRKQQGYPIHRMLLVMAVVVVLAAVGLNFYLRFEVENIMNDYSNGGQTYSEQVVIEDASGTNDNRSSNAITLFNSLLPIFTTCGTLFFSMMCSNPRKDEYLKALKEKCQLEDDIERYDTNLRECEIEESLYEDMIREDDDRFKCQEEKIREMEREFKSYVRDRLKIHIKDAAGISELSMAVNAKNSDYMDTGVA